MSDMRKILGEINHLDTYQRIDSTHPLNLYIGLDDSARWTLLLISEFQPLSVISSKMIMVKLGKRSDSKWTQSFSLVDDRFRDMFVLFCEDIVASSFHITNKEKAVRFVGKRYKEWREMLANARGDLLSPEEIKGLVGEMYYLKNYLASMYGIERAVLSWTGPRKLPQDFIYDDTWYEVKTISSGKNEINISSIEQLDSNKNGELVVFRADKTSVSNKNAVNLNSLYKDLMTLLPSDHSKEVFSNMLLRLGYYLRIEYESEEYTFEIKGIQKYTVNYDFPCIRRTNLPASVTSAKYILSIAAIEPYKKE